jgi:hypothetical protein
MSRIAFGPTLTYVGTFEIMNKKFRGVLYVSFRLLWSGQPADINREIRMHGVQEKQRLNFMIRLLSPHLSLYLLSPLGCPLWGHGEDPR